MLVLNIGEENLFLAEDKRYKQGKSEVHRLH